MTYRGRDWASEFSYWFKSARVTTNRPLWPRECSLTGKTLWLKPCIRGETSYYMRSGTKRYDIRWADPKSFTLFGVKGSV